MCLPDAASDVNDGAVGAGEGGEEGGGGGWTEGEGAEGGGRVGEGWGEERGGGREGGDVTTYYPRTIDRHITPKGHMT